MKKFIALFCLLLAAVFIAGCAKNGSQNQPGDQAIAGEDGQELFRNTLDISREYTLLHWKTDKVLKQAGDYADYARWKNEVDAVLEKWSRLEEKAAQLENEAQDYAQPEIGFNLINTAHAVTTQEINNVFDKAPAGKKIRTLAKFLGVDAKRAFAILQQAQNQTQADAWNEAGDSFEDLENAAIVIKDGCKVAGFVGGVAISGGTAGLAAASTATKAVVVVSGADLVLEVAEDSAKIALGNDNDVSKFIGDARKITEPAASILAIANIPGNLESGFDKFSAVMIALDQFRSGIQENKVIGIALPDGQEGKIKGGTMTEEEIEEWLDSMGISSSDKDFAELMKMIQEKLEPENDSSKEESAEEEPAEEPVAIEEEAIEEEQPAEAKSDFLSPASAYGKDGKVKAVFASPLERQFTPGQARHWKVEISGFDRQLGMFSYCDFVFYLDGVKHYEQLDNDTCGFTGSSILKEGSLRADVTVNFAKRNYIYDDDMNYIETKIEIIDSIDLSQEYEVVTPN
jgi:hypothetical protein